jgi:proteasome lid subunit RPN8/RPN11
VDKVESEPYPEIERWIIPRLAIDATLDEVKPANHPGIEAGVFWLGCRSTIARVEAVVTPKGYGVNQFADCWQVSYRVYGGISAWATDAGLGLLAVCHTHGGPSPARLSRRDRTHSVKAPGVLAAVIGRDGDETDWTRWGWYEWNSGDYWQLSQSARSKRLIVVSDGTMTTWRADAFGVVPV